MHLWCNAHSISINACGAWRTRARFKYLRKSFTHTHIYLDYFRVEFLSRIKKNSHILVIMLNITNRSPWVFLLLFFFMWNRILLLPTLSVCVWSSLLKTWIPTFTPYNPISIYTCGMTITSMICICEVLRP